MDFRRAAVSFLFRLIINIICKMDCREYVKALLKNKPMIVAFNHINFLEVPVLVGYSHPLYVTGLAKKETWDSLIFSFIFNTYRAIPIDRSGSFIKAFKLMRKRVNEGYFMCIAPEGKRSVDGILRHGKAGIIQFAIDENLPILPTAHYGGENIWKNIKRFKRTPFCFRAGKPFRIKFEGQPGKEEREQILTEVMGQMAVLLPERMRGVYAEQAVAFKAGRKCKYLEFIQ